MCLEQCAILLLDTVEAIAQQRVNVFDPLVFQFLNSLAAGNHWLRLRADGAESVLIDKSGPAPIFDPTQQIVVPP